MPAAHENGYGKSASVGGGAALTDISDCLCCPPVLLNKARANIACVQLAARVCLANCEYNGCPAAIMARKHACRSIFFFAERNSFALFDEGYGKVVSFKRECTKVVEYLNNTR